MTRQSHYWTSKHRRNASAGSVFRSAKPLSLEHQARRVRFLLQELGLEHSCFSIYLSSRIDLLPAEYCRELAHTPLSAPPLPPDEVRRIVLQELGHNLELAFAEFDHQPFESTLIGQSHRAKLATGAPVIVALLRPQYYQAQREDGACEFLQTELINEQCSNLLSAEVIADFVGALRRKTNFSLAREGMECMGRDAASFELLRSHRTYPELSTGRLFTFEFPEGEPLDQVLHDRLRSTAALARRLCQVWFHQALNGSCFPVDPQLQNVLASVNNQISFVNCDQVGLPNSAKENLRNYFTAMLSDDPDKAATYLLREMAQIRAGAVDVDHFRSSFRQAAYFGMLEPILGTDSNALAQITFQHWKTAIEHGYSAKTHLLCFYRGLFAIARIARQISPAGDPLREGMEDLRSTGAFEQIKEIMDWRYWFQNSDKFATAMVQLPRVFDEALTRVSEPTPEPQGSAASFHEERGASTANLTFLLVLVVVISQLPNTHGWSDKILVVALMVAGLLALRRSD